MLVYNDRLYHHGVKGMKWGVRRFQRKDGSLTPAGKKRYSENSKQPQEQQRKGLTSGQKKAIAIGATAVATALAAYGTYRLAKSVKLDNFIDIGKHSVDNILHGKNLPDPSTVRGFKKLESPESIDKAVTKANPTRSMSNCYNCVVATVGRMCGLDVTAKGDTRHGKGMEFDDICRSMGLNPDDETQVRRMTSPSVDRIAKVIGRKYKEGDCGAISFCLNNEYKKITNMDPNEIAGHTLNWTIKDGAVSFMDGQNGGHGDAFRQYLSMYMDSGKEASIAKFANVNDGFNVEFDALKEFVK